MVSEERNELNKQRELSKNIVDYLKGRTGNNFQNDMNYILVEYYNYHSKTFEMPQAMRGDYKNDGWVVEDNIYYMMFSPIFTKESFYKEIQDKFESDLKGLLKFVYEKSMWGKNVNKAILIVNSKDGRLPPDNERAYDTIAQKYKEMYNINFEYKIVNLDFVQELLEELPSDILEKINFRLNMARGIDYNEPSAIDIINTIGIISKNIGESFTKNLSSDYTRVSTPEKITMNELDELRDEIDSIITKLGVVETAVKEMSQDVTHMEQFEFTKNYIISKYLEHSVDLKGVDLFNKIIEVTCNLFPKEDNRITEIKYLIVFIFDKCDIFKKEVERV